MSEVQKSAIQTLIYFKAKLNPIEVSLLTLTDINLGSRREMFKLRYVFLQVYYLPQLYLTLEVKYQPLMIKVVFNEWDPQISLQF